MPYTPINTPVYLRAFAGAIAGMTCSGKYPTAITAASYSLPAQMADAWAQEVDTVWGAPTPTNFELEAIEEVSEAIWENRSTLPTAAVGHGGSNVAVATNPASYLQTAEALVALVQQGNAQVVSEGVDPDDTGGGSGTTPTSPTPYLQANLYVDPAGTVPGSSDSNTGVNPTNVPPGSGPISTTTEVNRRFYQHDVQVDATVTYLSDDASGTGLNLSTTIASTGTLTFQGTPTILRSGHTFSAVQAMTPSTNTRQTITDGVFSFAALLGNLVVDKTGGNSNTSAWLVSGTTSPLCTAPFTFDVVEGTFSPGDSYVVQRGCHLTLAPGPAFLGRLAFNDFAFLTGSIGPQGEQSANVFCLYNRCSFPDFIGVGGVYANCYAPNGVQATDTLFFIGGVLITTHFDIAFGAVQFDGDAMVTGFGLVVSPTNYADVTFSGSLGSGTQFQSTTGDAAISCWSSLPVGFIPGGGGAALIWGTGNAGPGVLVGPGAAVTVSTTTPPIVTGSSDFAFVPVNSAVLITAARAVAADNTVSASVATSWANLAAGTLNWQAHYFPTNAAVVGASAVL